MRWSSRGAYFTGCALFALSWVPIGLAMALPAEQGVASHAGVASLRLVVQGAGLMVASGLLMVAGAVLAVAERLPEAARHAEPGTAPDRPRGSE